MPRSSEDAPVSLHCLAGQAAPPHIADDLRKLLALPEKAREHFWEILGPNLSDPVPPGIGEQVSRFCNAVGVSEALLAPPIRACRFLVRRAAAEDLNPTSFAEDVSTLADGDPALVEIVMSGYETGKRLVREQMIRETLAAHGKMLESVDWRIDFISASSQGKNLRVPVIVLTFGYREGDRVDRITLQVLPEAMRTLKKLWDRLVS